MLSGDQIFVTILMPGPMVDAVTQDLMYWPFAAAGLALMIAPLSGDQIFVTILMPGPMVDAVTQDLMYWPFAAAGLALMIAPMSAL